MREIKAVKEIFRLQRIQETISDKFVRGQVDEVISYVKGTIRWKGNNGSIDLTESGKIFLDRALLLAFGKKYKTKLKNNPEYSIIVRRNPYFNEDGTLTSFNKESIENGFKGRTIYKKQVCVA